MRCWRNLNILVRQKRGRSLLRIDVYKRQVYEMEKLAMLSGKKLHGKRNHINKFKAMYENRWSYEKMMKDNLEDCFQMALKWRNDNGCNDDEEKNAEMCVTLNSLRLFEELEDVYKRQESERSRQG